ncbi:MAG: hypothetical protein O3C40_28635 [Planctomycetota bacterium]|nr:hypothetical protein [Planctomycetota bacterium]
MNHIMNRKLTYLAIAVAMVLLAPLPASPAEVATASITPSGLSLSPNVENNGGVLTVSGNDINIRRTFGPGERPSFDARDDEGNALPDGIYKWELRLNSTRLTAVDDGTNGRSQDAVEASQRATRGRVGLAGNGRRFQLPTESGAFTVRFGGILDPNETEGTDTGAATQ